IPAADRLIFALDVPSAAEARRLVDTLGDSVRFYKLGLELFTSGGYFELVDELLAAGKKIFADLKLYDVPETVAAAVRQLRKRPITFTTVHGNDSIMAAAAREKGDLKILAVTVLTSLDQNDLRDLGYHAEVGDLVLARARRARETGCDGVIASGLEAQSLRRHLGEDFLIVTPGIRPVDDKQAERPADDQKRVVNVEQALRNGADYIVVGRPIRNVPDPYQAAMQIQETLRSFERRTTGTTPLRG
ncbi:MAG TPA: orotidine-5'-phosphate decarboxylase, partial [Thermoanaerobaculia bacterium]|nr:orotidine-5'-phosphate decarboxylase [Thermoanaerobaculia bacterium]